MKLLIALLGCLASGSTADMVRVSFFNGGEKPVFLHVRIGFGWECDGGGVWGYSIQRGMTSIDFPVAPYKTMNICWSTKGTRDRIGEQWMQGRAELLRNVDRVFPIW
jgi:hypothetical protein